jgi:hypothetical protein
MALSRRRPGAGVLIDLNSSIPGVAKCLGCDEMSFESSFDGFIVIHAPLICPERRAYFERELDRVGIEEYSVIEAKATNPDDPRLIHYAGGSNSESRLYSGRMLSLIDNFLAAIDTAQQAGWRSVVIFEDDIAFRSNFERLWSGVEREVNDNDRWGVLTLHRITTEGRFLVSEPVWRQTSLVPVFHNLLAQCVIVRRAFYQAFRSSLLECVDRGYPDDFFYGIFATLNKGRLYATNRNLTGQAKNLASTLTLNGVSGFGFCSRFRGAPWPVCLVANPAHSVYTTLKRRLHKRGGNGEKQDF